MNSTLIHTEQSFKRPPSAVPSSSGISAPAIAYSSGTTVTSSSDKLPPSSYGAAPAPRNGKPAQPSIQTSSYCEAFPSNPPLHCPHDVREDTCAGSPAVHRRARSDTAFKRTTQPPPPPGFGPQQSNNQRHHLRMTDLPHIFRGRPSDDSACGEERNLKNPRSGQGPGQPRKCKKRNGNHKSRADGNGAQ